MRIDSKCAPALSLCATLPDCASVSVDRDPLFFDRVDQFALEVHLSEMWALNNAHFLNYGRLLALLIRSGFLLQHVYLDFCSGG